MNDLTPMDSRDAQRGEVIEGTYTEVHDVPAIVPPEATDAPPTGDAQPAEAVEPEFFNDAELLGADCPEFEAILEQPVTLMIGEMWGAKDRRNTQDGYWKQVTMPWVQWIDGKAGDKNTAAWGFSRHPEGKEKAGACVVFGSSVGQARKAKAMNEMFAMGIDIDSGAQLDDVLAKLEELGLFCLVYTSHSHGKRGLQLKHDVVIQKLKIKPSELNKAQVQKYLREIDKNRYDESFISKIEIKEMKKQVKEGVVIELSTPPLDKFRLIFPLVQPVKIIDLAETQGAALEVWEDKITGLATELLGVHFDTSCTDPSRLFYTARHPKDAEDWFCGVVRGKPLAFEDVPSVKKSDYTRTRTAQNLNAFEIAGGAADNVGRAPLAFAPSGASLNDWHRMAKSRFGMADLLEDQCRDRIRIAGGEPTGHIHIECPFEHEHTSEGGTASMAVNALDAKGADDGEQYWTWFCLHDACRGRHKLEFLEEALRQQWFSEDLLFGDSLYLMPGADDNEDEDVLIEGEHSTKAERAVERSKSVRKDLLDRAKAFDNETTESQIAKIIAEAIEADADRPAMAALKAELTTKTYLGARDFNEMVKQAKKEAKKARKGKAKADTRESVIPECGYFDDFDVQIEYVKERVRAQNEVTPTLFNYGGVFATADAVRHQVRLITLRDQMNAVLRPHTRWRKPLYDGETRVCAMPEDVLRAIYQDFEFADTLPELLSVVATPFFDRDGNLVNEDGYHPGARVILSSGGLEVPRVSAEPTPEEVMEARRLIVEEILADFPLAGLNRAEIMATLDREGDGPASEGEHAVTHAVAMAILPFMREMVQGPTPGHVLTKPSPGTGASLLVEALTSIASGKPAPAMELPDDKREISKTLSAALTLGDPFMLFDNVGKAIASSALAMAMTGTTYQARILGKSQTVAVPVRVVWVMTGNNISASEEIIRRMLLIPLDAGVHDPKSRKPDGGWRHPNVRDWVNANRARLVWACLTLIQNWIATGKKPFTKATLASFESWAEAVGGVLAAAGFRGFLEGQKEERAKAVDSNEDGLAQLLFAFSAYPSCTLFRPGGNARFSGTVTHSIMDMLNGTERHDDLGETLDPIQISGWGYSSHDGQYNTAGKIGAGMKLLARKPHQSGEVVMEFEELADTRGGGKVYKMTKARADGAQEGSPQEGEIE